MKSEATVVRKKSKPLRTTMFDGMPPGDVYPPRISADHRYQMIAMGAYFCAERRGFAPGAELADWLAAEAEVDRVLSQRGVEPIRRMA